MRALATTIGCLLALAPAAAAAVAPLSRAQLAQLCAYADEPAGSHATRCELYLLGFLDGAASRGPGPAASDDSFIDRAARTRLGAPPRGALQRFRGYCLANPLPLDEVIAHVRDSLAADAPQPVLARDVVDATLRRHFPCPG